MNILTNICNPKEEHFQQEARTEAYKPINDYVFQNRSMERMRARHDNIQNPEEYKYQSWNHPYSISNYFMQKKGAINNGQNKQSLGGTTDYMSYPDVGLKAEESHVNKKISFKEIPQAICGIGKEEQEGEQLFSKREEFYASLRANQNSFGKGGFSYQGRNYNHEDNHFVQYENNRFSKVQNLQNQQQSLQQNHSHVLLTQQILKLKQENKDLKRVIEEEYKPMKELYNKLLSEQEEREYLISKLQWKVKELVKEMGATSGSIGHINTENQTNFNTKRQNKMISRVDSQKHLGQTSMAQPFKNFETKFANIKIQEYKANTFTNNYQSHGQNINVEAKQYGQTNNATSHGLQNYQQHSTLHTGVPTYQASYSIPQQFNGHYHPQTSTVQQNHYTSTLHTNSPQYTNFQTNNGNFGQNLSKQVQNYPATPSFSHQNPVFQAHYNQTNTKINY